MKKYDENAIKVFLADRYTRKEAERAIDCGSYVIEGNEREVENFVKEWNESAADEDDMITVKQVKAGKVPDVYPVECEGEMFYIVSVH